MVVSLIMDLNNDILERINEIRIRKEKLVNVYVRYIYKQLMIKNTDLIYYYLKFDNNNVKAYLINKTRLMKIYNYKYKNDIRDLNKFNLSGINHDDKLFSFTDLIDDIVIIYNEIILNLYNYIVKYKDRLLEEINIDIIPSVNIEVREDKYETMFEDYTYRQFRRHYKKMKKEYIKYNNILVDMYNNYVINNLI